MLRAKLLCSVYHNDFTMFSKILGGNAGDRKLTPEILKEWYYFFLQCTECRRRSVYCPYGTDTTGST